MWLSGKKNTAGDEELALNYFNSGDKRYVGELFEKHVRTVFGVCLFYFRDKDVARDVVMQIFEKLLVELRKTKVKNFKAWLGFVVRNHCLSELRKTKGKRFLPETYLDFEIRDANLEDEEKIAEVSEDDLLQYLKETLPMLKDKQKLCVELFYMDNYSYQQISEKTGFLIPEVKSYIQNGKRNLKLMIEQKIRNKDHAA
jgi:RNA polymerase sigma-70 factor (ECF subfamily)